MINRFKIMMTIFAFLVPLCASALPQGVQSQVLSSSRSTYQQQFENYFEASFRSLDCMRGIDALVADRMFVPPISPAHGKLKLPVAGQGICAIPTNERSTSPTNIGLDLLVQLEALSRPSLHDEALQNLHRILQTLNTIPYHKDSGLFFERYNSLPQTTVADQYVSSVDNIHLALALWTVARIRSDDASQKTAQLLFDRMHFEQFYDAASGLMSGGLIYKNGTWTPETWRYRYFGAEARSLYSIAWAIGLIHDPGLPQHVAASFEQDVYVWNDGATSRRLLGLWDGGAFQLFLPEILARESSYSVELKAMFGNYSLLAADRGARGGYPVPANFSASQFGVEGKTCDQHFPCYNGKAGTPELVATQNQDISDPTLRPIWDVSFTPHAAVLAATALPSIYAPLLSAAEHQTSTDKTNILYHDDLGWMDGYFVRGTKLGDIVPVVLSLDQGMLAMASAMIVSSDGQTVSSRALSADKDARRRLTEFYKAIDSGLLSVAGQALPSSR